MDESHCRSETYRNDLLGCWSIDRSVQRLGDFGLLCERWKTATFDWFKVGGLCFKGLNFLSPRFCFLLIIKMSALNKHISQNLSCRYLVCP